MGHNIDDMQGVWAAEPIVYRIDWQDRITFVNDGWTKFAIENDAPELTAANVLDRSLWDFITDSTTIQLYRDLIGRVRAGRGVQFPFRCDGPRVRRFLQMEMSITRERGTLEFATTVVRHEDREAPALLAQAAAFAASTLRICSWCKQVDVRGRWLEVEDAVRELALFDAPAADLTHGMCEACAERFAAAQG
jgi:hypothetical protein